MSTIYVSQVQIRNIIKDSNALGVFIKNTLNTEKCNYLVMFDLNSEERNLVYKQMKYPYKFEKIKSNDEDDEEVSIRIYINGSFNENKTLPPKKRKLFKELEIETVVNNELEPEPKIKQVEESEESEQENSEELEQESEQEDSEESEELEYTLSESWKCINDIKTMYNNQIEMYKKIIEIENNTKKLVRRTNLILLSSLIGWTLLLTFDPVRLIVTHINN